MCSMIQLLYTVHKHHPHSLHYSCKQHAVNAVSSNASQIRGFSCALETLQALLLDLIRKEIVRVCLSVLLNEDIFLQPFVRAPLKAQEICVGMEYYLHVLK